MTCPECQIAYDPDHWDTCPHCGCEHDIPVQFEFSGVIRTSTILIAAGGKRLEVYRSVEEVPEPLRRLLLSSTNGLNSGTIYIADEGGREQITKSLRSLPSATTAPVLTRLSSAVTVPPERGVKQMVPLSTLWISLVMALFSGALVWLVESRW